MRTPTTARMIARDTNASEATSLSEMTMISADRMKSVRTAPVTIVFSSGSASSTEPCSSAWPLTRCQIFSAAS